MRDFQIPKDPRFTNSVLSRMKSKICTKKGCEHELKAGDRVWVTVTVNGHVHEYYCEKCHDEMYH